jgi:YidC/Oxa1 family membrane protein insertase
VTSTYFMSQSMDKLQRRLMMVLPLIFITVIAHFPVGLVIYWVTTNLWTVGQGLITRRLVPKTAAVQAGPKRSSRTPAQAPAAVEEQPAGNGAKTEPENAAPAPKPRQPSTQPRRVKRNRGHGRR